MDIQEDHLVSDAFVKEPEDEESEHFFSAIEERRQSVKKNVAPLLEIRQQKLF